MGIKVPIPRVTHGWTSRPLVRPGYTGKWSRNEGTATGELLPDKGFKIHRKLTVATNKPGASWVHQHTDGTEDAFYYHDTKLYPEDGSDAPTAFKSSLAEVWQPMVASMSSPLGGSFFVNGTNTEAQWIREDGSGDLEAVTADLEQPDGNWTATAVTSGGSMADGTYLVRISQSDQTAGYVTHRSEPAAAKTVTISGGGGSGKITVAHNTWTPNARADFWTIGVTAAGGTDTPTGFLQNGTDIAIASTTQDVTDISGDDTQAFANRNGFYRLGAMPLTAVDCIIEHEGRFWASSSKSNKVYWAERDTQMWYATNAIDSGAESGWNAPVVGMVSAKQGIYVFTTNSVHLITGSFRVDTSGNNPLYTHDVWTDVIDRNIGGVSRAAIDNIGGVIYFMSTRGPAVIHGNGVALLGHRDVRPFLKDLDWSNATRWGSAEDPENNYWCLLVTRKTNASRAMDGAATSGIADTILRWDLVNRIWAEPLWLEATHLATRKNGAKGGNSQQTFLMAMGPHGQVLRLNYGHSGGGPDDVTGANYDGQTASASSTTSATLALSGVSNDDLIGQLIALYYPSDDTNTPDTIVVRTISDNTASVVTWIGALVVPTNTNWTARIAAWVQIDDRRMDLSEYVQTAPDAKIQVQGVEVRYEDLIGQESVA